MEFSAGDMVETGMYLGGDIFIFFISNQYFYLATLDLCH
jgi:hypothetical protein